jgi:hypothetical protein
MNQSFPDQGGMPPQGQTAPATPDFSQQQPGSFPSQPMQQPFPQNPMGPPVSSKRRAVSSKIARVIAALEGLAGTCEGRGCSDLAERIDRISNTLESRFGGKN